MNWEQFDAEWTERLLAEPLRAESDRHAREVAVPVPRAVMALEVVWHVSGALARWTGRTLRTRQTGPRPPPSASAS